MDEDIELPGKQPTNDKVVLPKIAKGSYPQNSPLKRGRQTVTLVQNKVDGSRKMKQTISTDGDVSKLVAEIQQERKRILKEGWRRALFRKLQEEGKEKEYWTKEKHFNRLVAKTAKDRLLKELMEEEFPEEFPVGTCFQVFSTLDELYVYLWEVLTKLYQERNND